MSAAPGSGSQRGPFGARAPARASALPVPSTAAPPYVAAPSPVHCPPARAQHAVSRGAAADPLPHPAAVSAPTDPDAHGPGGARSAAPTNRPDERDRAGRDRAGQERDEAALAGESAGADCSRYRPRTAAGGPAPGDPAAYAAALARRDSVARPLCLSALPTTTAAVVTPPPGHEPAPGASRAVSAERMSSGPQPVSSPATGGSSRGRRSAGPPAARVRPRRGRAGRSSGRAAA